MAKQQQTVSKPETAINHMAPFGNPDLPEMDVSGDNALTSPAPSAPRFTLEDFIPGPAPRAITLEDFFPQAPSKGKAKKAPSLKQGADLDAFGNRLGTALALVNKILMEAQGPLSMKQICLRCHKFGTDTYYNHMRRLVTLGLAEKTQGGYQLTAQGRQLGQPVTAP